MVENSEFLTNHSSKLISKISLSDSMTADMLSQFRQKKRKTESKGICTVCNENLGVFGAKRENCELCDVSLCNKCGIRKELHPLFGFPRPIHLCQPCESLVTIFKE